MEVREERNFKLDTASHKYRWLFNNVNDIHVNPVPGILGNPRTRENPGAIEEDWIGSDGIKLSDIAGWARYRR